MSEEKAALAERTPWANVCAGRGAFEYASSTLVRSDHDDPATNDEAVAELIITVKDSDPTKVGRPFQKYVNEMGLANSPGLFARGRINDGTPYEVYWPAMVPRDVCHVEVVIADRRHTVLPRIPQPPR